MRRPSKRFLPRLRAGLTLVELLVSIAALGLLGCCVLTYRMAPPCENEAVMAVGDDSPAPPEPPAPTAPPGRYAELSLQETLDRLGYTINVPHVFHGQKVAANGYRVSTRDDSVGAGWFTGNTDAAFREVCRQSLVGHEITFGARNEEGETTEILAPTAQQSGIWFGRAGGRSATVALSSPVRFTLALPAGNGYTDGPLSTVSEENPD